MTARQARALFARERARFARLFPGVATARLRLVGGACLGGGVACRPRDVAAADRDRNTVTMLTRALALAPANIVGLLRHELGHLADLWIERPGREQRADDLAELVTGERISYDAARLQTVGPGRYPRPRNLHR